ncbi:hypothetical protein SAMCFNEI73_Ch0743 [Sinorhizobium americanum]|uniref:Uncharacterized protein n=1 Tax=Sinorhizobium americanum TaxID=194963 RepID=A0A1L3LJ04_9HYPH|nr:hypothetical protein SAMCCGM7_Ch0747 [Sinorhizobium americanum CCGM7]APG90067.1 hypothetical protein SAMCFNEI73_Ch0743 [Sinorhizobium americanum]
MVAHDARRVELHARPSLSFNDGTGVPQGQRGTPAGPLRVFTTEENWMEMQDVG